MKIICPVCDDYGTLMTKVTITKKSGKEYRYEKWYIYHNQTKSTKQKWCYLSKKYRELPEIKEAMKEKQELYELYRTTQNTTQNIYSSEMPKSSFPHQISNNFMRADSSVWNECLTCTQEDAGSIPARSTKPSLEKKLYQEIPCFLWLELLFRVHLLFHIHTCR